MKTVYCWRCQCDVPMLDDDEWRRFEPLWRACWQDLKRRTSDPLAATDVDAWKQVVFRPALDEWERVTGFRETNHLALLHHRLSLCGPPCEACGRLLRTPEARQCAECGATV